MLRGQLEQVRRDLITGWAWETDTPGTPVSVLLTANDILIARVLARTWREDLEQAGIGSGRHSFEFRLGPLLALPIRYVVAARRETDGVHLPGSPAVIEAPLVFDTAAREGFATLIATAESSAEFEERITYLAAQMDRLLQRRAEMLRHRTDQPGQPIPWRWSKEETGNNEANQTPRALVVDETTPAAGRNAGSNAMLSHVASLRRLGFEVAFAAADMQDTRSADLDALGVLACNTPWYRTIEEVLRRDANAFQLVYLHRIGVAARYLPLVRFYQTTARVVFSVADLSHVRLARQAQLEVRPELLAFSRGRQAGERIAALAADVVLTHSDFELEVLRREGVPATKLHCVRWSATIRPTAIPFEARHGVAFIGSYAHEPNVDAACWLVEAVMPLVWRRQPHITCLLAGSQMPPPVRDLARRGVEVLGQVQTVETVFDRVRLTVAPLRFGAGVKGKVVDSLAAGVPCACTPIASEGLGLPGALLAFLGDSPERLAAAIVQLHEDRVENQAASDAGLTYIADVFSTRRLDMDLRRAIIGG